MLSRQQPKNYYLLFDYYTRLVLSLSSPSPCFPLVPLLSPPLPPFDIVYTSNSQFQTEEENGNSPSHYRWEIPGAKGEEYSCTFRSFLLMFSIPPPSLS